MAGFFRRRATKVKKTLSDWLEVGILVDVFSMVKDIFVTIFFPWKREKGETETFEAAMQRMNLTEADLADRKRMFFTQTILYLIIGMCVLGYTVWLAFHGYWVGTFLAFLVSVLSFAYAFRSHFWLFQIKQKKLGCTFREYLDSSL